MPYTNLVIIYGNNNVVKGDIKENDGEKINLK